MSESPIYQFDFTRLKMPDFILCLYIIQHIQEPDAYLSLLLLIEKTCVGFADIPFMEAEPVQRAFIAALDSYMQGFRTLDSFLNSLEEKDGSEKQS